MDFFVREVRECIDGDLAIIRYYALLRCCSDKLDIDSRFLYRLGSCGALIDVPVGSVVVPRASVAVSRNYDFDFVHPENSKDQPYFISRPVHRLKTYRLSPI